ncbi:MAG: Hsp70 family protein [Desulfobacterales bacterium]|nr:Hsp70 family protein [Desulfobacterales bacterium]
MFNLGLDFGTTTSILTYQTDQNLESFKFGGAKGTEYIPSCVSIDKNDQTIEIGPSAYENQGDNYFEVFTNFKMLLAEKRTEILESKGYNEKYIPREIAKLYIKHLLDKYQSEKNLSTPIEKMIITVPEIWIKQGRNAARESLKQICTDLQIPAKLLSEPVAAAVYFAHNFKIREGHNFNGHVLVCDYGGGTLDLSLTSVQNDEIKVLEGTGMGNISDTLGKAGVAYDESVVKHMLRKNNKTVSEPKQFYELLKRFEEKKIIKADTLQKRLMNYLNEPSANMPVFEINGLPFETEDFVIVFKEVIQDILLDALKEMSEYLKKHNVNTKKGENFRVVMVGGFSSFFLVKNTVKTFFNSQLETDKRFASHFDLVDTALATSKGAALVANDMFKIDTACPISTGIRIRHLWRSQYEDFPILKRGVLLSQYQEPQFMPKWIPLMSEKAFNEESITLFIDTGKDRKEYISLEGKGSLQEILPNPHNKNKWQFGFSVSDELIFSLHAVDIQGRQKITQLGNLENKIKDEG